MGLRQKNFNIMGVHWKTQFLRGVHERGDLPKGGDTWTVWRYKRGLGEKRGFEGCWYPNHTLGKVGGDGEFWEMRGILVIGGGWFWNGGKGGGGDWYPFLDYDRIKWPNTVKQFFSNLATDCLSVWRFCGVGALRIKDYKSVSDKRYVISLIKLALKQN